MSIKKASQKKVKVSARIDQESLRFFNDDQHSENPIFKDKTDFLQFGAKLTRLIGEGRLLTLFKKAMEVL